MRAGAWSIIAVVAAISFPLHLAWEYAQAPLYACFAADLRRCLLSCLRATVGDTVLTLAFWATVAATTRDFRWVTSLRAPAVLALAAGGAAVAVRIEQQALRSGRWTYAEAMPVFPSLGVGVAPVLQMALLLPLTFLLTAMLMRRDNNHQL